MKIVILAGGLDTHISEGSHLRPKPMIEIGGCPILWHIMKIYTAHGVNDFIICPGYKGYVIKEYLANYFLHMSDVMFDMSKNKVTMHERHAEPWRIALVGAGKQSMTGGRLRRAAACLDPNEPFYFTYGDDVSDVDITRKIAFHRAHGKMATVAAVQPSGRYDMLQRDGDRVTGFTEKPPGDGSTWINGGFFVLNPTVIEYIAGEDTHWEGELMNRLAEMDELSTFEHHGFWQPMDTLRDKDSLEAMWQSGGAPWKKW